MSVEFISYSGKYPCLCHGTLIIKVDNKKYILDNLLNSGGSVTHDEDWNFTVSKRKWFINDDRLPEELKKHRKEIKEIINRNVEYGCCGGCI